MRHITGELVLPEQSLDGALHLGTSALDSLGEDFIEGLGNALTFNGKPHPKIINPQGRNYYMALPNPYGAFDSLQISGGGNFEIGIRSNSDVDDGIVTLEPDTGPRLITPPDSQAELFTGVTVLYEGGQLVDRKNPNPLGSYTHRTAEQKIANTREAAVRLGGRVAVPYVLGRFEYDLADQNGEPQTAILLLVPQLGRRFDATLLHPLGVLRGVNRDAVTSESIVDYYEEIIGPRLSAIGLAIGEIHKSGLNHNQLTPGNTAVIERDNMGLGYITDWDTMTEPSTDDRIMAQALDMTVAFRTNAAPTLALYREHAIDKVQACDLIGLTVCQLLGGYRTARDGSAFGSVDGTEMIDVVEGNISPEKAVQTVADWLT